MPLLVPCKHRATPDFWRQCKRVAHAPELEGVALAQRRTSGRNASHLSLYLSLGET